VTEEQARWRPPSPEGDAWSILEVAQHALAWARSVNEIIEALTAGRTAPVLPLGYLDRGLAGSIEEARRALAEASIRLASMPGRLPPTDIAATTAVHPWFGALDDRGWFLFSRLHDSDHLQHVASIQAMEGYPA
jgi:hypothetical protein